MFWYVFILVRASGFSDFLQPFHSKTRFWQVRGHQISHMFNMFCRRRSKSRFLVYFLSFLMLFCVPFGTNFEKKTLPKIVSKKGALLSQTIDYDRGPGLPDSPPRVRTSQTRNNSSSSKCCSNSCPCLWLRKIARKWLFELAAIANVSKQMIKMKRIDVKSTSPVI